MASLREKYHLWRKRSLPASKADVVRLHDRIRDDITTFTQPLQSATENIASKLNTTIDSVRIVENLIRETRAQPQLEAKDLSLAFSFSKLGRTVAEPELVSHSKWQSYLSRNFNKPGTRILEIGSRNVTGVNSRKLFFSQADYIGFDIYEGENVDVVGDAHRLSSYFSKQKFDLILSSAVFEHLHMPWIVAYEIYKLLELGVYVFVETHFSFSTHERPWNFFQFSDIGLRALFNHGMGFEFIDGGDE